jgi:ABC-type transporter Mla MlaB component
VTEPAAPGPSPAQPRRPALALSGRIGTDDAPGLCDRVREALVRQGGDPVRCDCGEIADPDVGTVDALARMALTARRGGGRLEFLDACPDLRELLRLVGLAELAVEVVGQPEEREESFGVEEEGDPRDPVT